MDRFKSIIKTLGTKSFVRIRVGILPSSGKPKNVEEFVIKKFQKAEIKKVKEVLSKTAEAIEFILKSGPDRAMTEFNK